MNRTVFLALLVNVAALLACGGSSFERARGGVVVATCKRTADCYDELAYACPYGFTELPDRTRGELRAKCKPPTFCDEGTLCAAGFTCIDSKSKQYEGRQVCALR